MTLVVPFALVLGFLALLLAVAVFLLWRKRRNARVEAAAFAETLAARERRREARSKKTGLLTRREIESIAPESIHAPPPCDDEVDVGCDDDGGNDRGGGELGAGKGGPEKLIGASGSITSSSLDGDGEELRGARGGGGAGSSAPQAGSLETPFPSKVDPQGTRDYTEADHRGDADANADGHPLVNAGDEGRRPEGAVKRQGADYLPGSTLTCAICLGTFGAVGRGRGGRGGEGVEVVASSGVSPAQSAGRCLFFVSPLLVGSVTRAPTCVWGGGEFRLVGWWRPIGPSRYCFPRWGKTEGGVCLR